MDAPADSLLRLNGVLGGIGRIAVAVSGGVDSLTLAAAASLRSGDDAEMFHAVSPAVPAEATQRVVEIAATRGWCLQVIDAGEFGDVQYRANPLNRCFYCKTNLYSAIAPRTTAQIVSGTNLDDLGEYRPGLEAAKRHAVRHPFVEAGIDKQGVRELARRLGLGEVAELPASPCLSSRVETGIAIDARMLDRVHAAERMVGEAVSPRTVRCRVRAKGVVIELDPQSLAGLAGDERDALAARVQALFRDSGFVFTVTFAPYRIGSAFLHEPASLPAFAASGQNARHADRALAPLDREIEQGRG